ncbi:UDP-N-acetylmuramoyl-L-alanyl-D-glutamate--2,6-diaminopimelate ligase [Blattabacterium cuenoti]|uniref:UDP-N-acetylmuramoyl-L-alanyl-D-glutamate--2, 6-diaminopimelate ligase n=1 Tax=Blattabacterium cuenoti TaxID=1653831 RepID=UPI00163D1611|nr:UDP-N-acetylmuramoyl-L-alanyl-D-glutamate--2,6-diaminopimelate ligase [Blattabacterium cuenoti]
MTITLENIIKRLIILEILGCNYICNKIIKKITINSKLVKNNTIFIAKKGKNIDGHFFIEEAINNGANVIVCEKKMFYIKKNITYIIVKNSEEALGIIASNFYDNPTKKINLIGIVGTNGKTTISTILHQMFNNMGEKNILISTIGIKILSNKYKSKNTTPDIIDINKYLNLSIKKGCKYAFMEVSSHGIHQKRTFGLLFKGGIFTNITHDHLDYHKSFDNYFYIKKKFFDNLPENSFSLINRDDKNCFNIVKNTSSKVYFYGLYKKSDFKAKILNNSFTKNQFFINGNKITINLIGKFNVYNILASYATSILLGKKKQYILKKLNNYSFYVKGRFEQFISYSGIRVIVDYAHNPNGLKFILETIKEIIGENKINLICVIGCGGNRDRKKRSIMGKIVYETCNISIFTSDNPRNEDPKKILMEMKNFNSELINKKPIITFINRKKAIEYAISIAKKNDIILIAGKGHENYQEIMGKLYSFNDMKIAKYFLSKKYD